MDRWDARKLKWIEAREVKTGLHNAGPELVLQFAGAAIVWGPVKVRSLLLLSVSHASNPKQCDSPMQCSQSQSRSRALLRRVVIRGEARQGEAR